MLPVPPEADGVPVPAAEDDPTVASAVAEVVDEPVAPAVADEVLEPVPPALIVSTGVPAEVAPPADDVLVLRGIEVPALGVRLLLLFEGPPPPHAARNRAPIMKTVTITLNRFIIILLSPFEHYQ
jgi:hypothetical protein